VRGRAGTYRWSGAAHGLRLTDDGTVTGEPERTGELELPVRIRREDDGHEVAADLLITVNPPPVVRTEEAIQLTRGAPARGELEAEGGTPPLTWRPTPAPPSGIQVTGDGRLQGVAEAVGEFTLSVEVTDRWGASSEGTIPVHVREAQDRQQEPEQGQDAQSQQDGSQQPSGSPDQGDRQQEGRDQEAADDAGQDGQQAAGDDAQTPQSGQGENQRDPRSERGRGEEERAQDGERDVEDGALPGADDERQREAERRAADAAAQAQRIDEAAARRWLQELPEEPSGIQLFMLPEGTGAPRRRTDEPW